ETLADAKGKYFIRIYAVDRGDAGKYKLAITFKEVVTAAPPSLVSLDILDPPRLAAIPEEACDDQNFDPKREPCKNFCPKHGAPPDWPPCAGECPSTPDVNNP